MTIYSNKSEINTIKEINENENFEKFKEIDYEKEMNSTLKDFTIKDIPETTEDLNFNND